jgi:hypothetical protein
MDYINWKAKYESFLDKAKETLRVCQSLIRYAEYDDQTALFKRYYQTIIWGRCYYNAVSGEEMPCLPEDVEYFMDHEETPRVYDDVSFGSEEEFFETLHLVYNRGRLSLDNDYYVCTIDKNLEGRMYLEASQRMACNDRERLFEVLLVPSRP